MINDVINNKKILLIRVDCNKEIASGHLMRCLAIAEEARTRGVECIFIMSDSCSSEIVERNGFNLIDLKTDWRNLNSELPQIISIVNTYGNAVLLIDTYKVTEEYVNRLSPIIKIAYLGSKPEPLGKLSLLINYSSVIDTEFYNNAYPDTKLLLGTLFAPLRKEFQNIGGNGNEEVKSVLITTGNTDNCHIVSELLKEIKKSSELKDRYFDIVIGRLFDNAEEIQELADCSNMRLHTDVRDMSELMRSSQLALSANGTTIYELAACHVPTISFAVAAEQEESGISMDSLGIVDYCGAIFREKKKCVDVIIRKLILYLNDSTERTKLRDSASLKIDGNGSIRIVDEIINLFHGSR